jgi:uncharacterized membrane protein YgaE (UPF0421/DUF939 family)
LIVGALGTGALVVALVVMLAIAAALLLGAGAIITNQAAVSAILVATLTPPGGGLSPDRFVDALIGGAVALLVGQVLLSHDPAKALAGAARPVVDDLAVALQATARALREGNAELAERALEIARSTEDDLAAFYDAVAAARETLSVLPPQRRARERLPLYAEASRQIDYAARNTRVLARRSAAASRAHGPAPPELADAVSLLADAVRELGRALADPEREDAARDLALRAAARASGALGQGTGLSLSVVIAQVRSTAVDVLRGSGMGTDEARAALEAAVADAAAAH